MDDAGRRRWEERHATAGAPSPPSPFVQRALDLIVSRAPPRVTGRTALDVASGGGRHALLAAERGYRVVAVDWSRHAAAALAARARARQLALTVVVADVTAWPLPRARFDVVLVVDFLERALVPALRAAVRPGGVLVMETFLVGQERFGHPRAPEFLLQAGELRAACDGWTVLDAYEGETRVPRPACRAGIVAVRPLDVDTPDPFGSYPPR